MSKGSPILITKGAGRFSPGGYRPDRPSDKALPAGPSPDFVPVNARPDKSGAWQLKDATAENARARDTSLRPRRFSWDDQ